MAEVKVYTTSTCPYCHALKDYLKSKGVKYEEVNLDTKPDEVQNFVDTCGGRGVPCTHITKEDGQEETILGFDQARINSALALN